MTKTPEYGPSNYVMLTCTPRLRWVERGAYSSVVALANVHGMSTGRVLQQAWQDQSTGSIVWKDVPVEKEE